ncbi:hypothetical protein SLS58_002828 [Diplodia intermedia]|uniref:Uncharacterized protein n=1 Tax=Diplodia intermedia TaxID=856260 RepID=A0ABR3TXR7_9PEZI
MPTKQELTTQETEDLRVLLNAVELQIKLNIAESKLARERWSNQAAEQKNQELSKKNDELVSEALDTNRELDAWLRWEAVLMRESNELQAQLTDARRNARVTERALMDRHNRLATARANISGLKAAAAVRDGELAAARAKIFFFKATEADLRSTIARRDVELAVAREEAESMSRKLNSREMELTEKLTEAHSAAGTHSIWFLCCLGVCLVGWSASVWILI